MNDVAAEHGFIAIYPTGFLAWNAGDCCGAPMERDIDDVGFKAQTSGTTGTFQIDNVLIGTAWGDVTAQAVPEPGSLSLVLAGVASLGLTTRFRRTRK